MTRGLLAEQKYGQQCGPQNPLAPPAACGGGGGGGGKGTDWNPYSNWAATFGNAASQNYDTAQIQNTLRPLYTIMRQYNWLTYNECQQF
ncbi:MAG: hypothetical protein ACRD2O_15380 [Terriglobia bacterium]